mmetsp:Transcript_27196/g.78158  ORF Transcript_27196/g.78158 Transcript_27196/m.78158 type:complete len:230 (+) Transcript_27196:87-776(+)|eukprot:CAMPEP_0176070808 /NCGR_PEP_ID=MMETSP0120_2-20121206/35364_1 /TAXON_ID=160619 /ORGANISM="Kryptoperidinium foliaceum, Strain CCMP 1326" /LENGTH=229 /DNA_ID=CAMNT_0017404461 /DNA_START=33 /DNA_END=722 /DNA_ORIENTATION=+
MGTYRSTTRCALCFSCIAALLVFCDVAAQVAVYVHMKSFGMQIIIAVTGGLIAIVMPCFGWQGARDRNETLLGCFSRGSYLLGFCDLLVLGLCAFLLTLSVSMSSTTSACSSDALAAQVCDSNESHLNLVSLCNQFVDGGTASLVNPTLTPAQSGNMTEMWESLLPEQRCIDALNDSSSALATVGGVLLVVRCFDVCLHFASGHYGSKLRRMVEDDRLDESSCSDNDSA